MVKAMCRTCLGMLGLTLSGCMSMPGVFSVAPSSQYVKEICPDLEYEVVGEIKNDWRGFAILGQPLRSLPDINGFVASEVQRLRGDAAIDVRVDSDYRGVIWLFFFMDIYPQYFVNGKVIRFTNEVCDASAI